MFHDDLKERRSLVIMFYGLLVFFGESNGEEEESIFGIQNLWNEVIICLW